MVNKLKMVAIAFGLVITLSGAWPNSGKFAGVAPLSQCLNMWILNGNQCSLITILTTAIVR